MHTFRGHGYRPMQSLFLLDHNGSVKGPLKFEQSKTQLSKNQKVWSSGDLLHSLQSWVLRKIRVEPVRCCARTQIFPSLLEPKFASYSRLGTQVRHDEFHVVYQCLDWQINFKLLLVYKFVFYFGPATSSKQVPQNHSRQLVSWLVITFTQKRL